MKKFSLTLLALAFIYVAVNLIAPFSGEQPVTPKMNAATVYNQINNDLWSDVDASTITARGQRFLVPAKSRALKLNIEELKSNLRTVPLEKNVSARNSSYSISLPMPDGTMERFTVVESPMMEQPLADQYPDIKTYLGQGIDNPYSTVRFDVTPLGFHAMVLSPDRTVFIDPYSLYETEYYISYDKADYRRETASEFKCLTESSAEKIQQPSEITDFSTGEQLRTYRLAVAATGEFTGLFGGNVANTLASITTSVNRISGVYEKEFSVRMVLIANENLIIYTNGATDPYTNTNGSTMLGQNISNLNSVIGTANYDIGHVFSTWNGGGIANLSVVCTSSKAGGCTGTSNPVGDPWDIDYVAHEMGHQFSGNHTQNNLSCNANPSTAWEPGSGITIMGYAGVCAPNLANNSIPYFHAGNIFGEIVPFTQQGSGNSCAVQTATGNTPPVIAPITGGYTLPISTPFSLTGTATDAQGDALTYSWEQHDVGPQGNPNSPSGNAPLFRPFTPVTTGTRVFPKISDIVNNTQTLGEILPSYARNMSFWLTVRDNRAGGSGISYAPVLLSVSAAAGPFLVTSPNTAVTWPALSNQTVTWNVANTNAAPVNTSLVNILLSTDGGLTYPVTVLAGTPNDGSQSVVIPNNQSTTARIKVEAVANVYFDISNTNFTISSPVGVENQTSTTPMAFDLLQNYPNPFNPTTFLSYSLPNNTNVTLKVYDTKGNLVQTMINNQFKTAGQYRIEFDGSALASGIYYYKITTDKNTAVKKMILVK